MDAEITALLTTWGYGQDVIDKFKEEGIEVAHLKNLTEYSLEKIFPKIGERTTFMVFIQNMDCKEPPAKKPRFMYHECDSDATSVASTNSASTSHFSAINSLTIDELLKGETEGTMILSYYKTENKLNDYYRQKLADLIIRQDLRNDIRKSFPNTVIEYWSDMIINYFRDESYEVWAGCTKGKNRDAAAGRGILLNRYYNMRRKLIKVGAISKIRDKIDKEEKHTDDDTDDEYEDLIRWLQNTKTVNLVIENWDRTTAKRLSMLKGSMEIHKYMDDFPAIKCFDGYRLLETDFKNLYPDADLQLYGHWPTLSSFITSKLPIKEQNEINDCFTSDGKKVKTLRALTLLFPIKNIVMKKKKQWRPSRLETKDGLFQFVKSVADIQPTNQRKKEKFFELGLHLGPQLFAVSPDEDNITDCYMIINATMFNIGSPLKAFDVFFKSFHALNSCYPKEVEREMYFLQTSIYDIQCDTDKNIRDSKCLGVINEYNKFKPA